MNGKNLTKCDQWRPACSQSEICCYECDHWLQGLCAETRCRDAQCRRRKIKERLNKEG